MSQRDNKPDSGKNCMYRSPKTNTVKGISHPSSLLIPLLLLAITAMGQEGKEEGHRSHDQARSVCCNWSRNWQLSTNAQWCWRPIPKLASEPYASTAFSPELKETMTPASGKQLETCRLLQEQIPGSLWVCSDRLGPQYRVEALYLIAKSACLCCVLSCSFKNSHFPLFPKDQ